MVQYWVKVSVTLELEHVLDYASVRRVKTGLSGSPKGLKNVFNRFFGIGS